MIDDPNPSTGSGDDSARPAADEPDPFGGVVDGLSPAKAKAIVALLNEPTINKAAAMAGVAERTLHGWLDDEEFATAYRKVRRQAFAQAISLAMRYCPIAINTLAKTMVDTQSPYASRVAAATNLLRFGRESIELDDLAVRLEMLERAQGAQAHRPALRGWRGE